MDSLEKLLEKIGYSWVGEEGGIAEVKLVSNGLRVLLVENHSAPVVTVMKLYRVGSRNEGAGNSGATHFLEHMMFKGTTANNPADGRGFDDQLKPIGALYNATTWFDRTNYFECVGAEHLETCIRLEADRMRGLVLKKEDRDSEMSVVRNEFERGENDPDDVLDKELWKNSFLEHPYHIPTIGWRSDVEGVPMERLKEFYDTFYWPNNCTLVIVGDFDPGTTLRLVAKYFGQIPSSPKPIPEMYTAEPPQEGERRFKVRRAGDLPRVAMAFHVPEANHPDNYPLAVMAAILGGSRRSSRLYKRLVDSGLASQAQAYKWELRDPSLFQLTATVSPDAKVEDVEAALLDEIAKLAASPVTEEELRRAKAANRKGTTLTAADPMRYASQIAEAEACASWHWLVKYDDNFAAVSAADIQRVASMYFSEDNRTVGHFLPKEETPTASIGSPVASNVASNGDHSASGTDTVSGASSVANKPDASADSSVPEVPASSSQLPQAAPSGAVSSGQTKTALSEASLKEPADSPEHGLKQVRRAKQASFSEQVRRVVLDNGLVVQIMQNKGTGSVGVDGRIRAGNYCVQPDKTLVAGLTAYMLTKGSEKFSKTAIAEVLEEMGSRLDFRADNFTVNFGTTGTHVVSEDLAAYIALMADIMRNPLFLADELDKSKKEYRAWIMQQMASTNAMARSKLFETLYGPDCVYHDRTFADLLGELDKITVDDLKAFHKAHYSPKGAILTLVGDFDVDSVQELVKASFGDWSGPEPKSVIIPDITYPTSAQRIEIPMADKKNVDIVIGRPAALKRTASDFFAAKLANAALGEDTLASRLGIVVREKHGLTYGIGSGFDNPWFGGAPWLIRLSVNPVNVDKALALVADVVSDYRAKGITDKELSDEAGRAAGSFKVQLRTSYGMASVLTQFEFLGLGAAAIDRYADDLKAVTKDAVNAAIAKYLDLSTCLTVLAGTFVRQDTPTPEPATARA